MIYIRFENFKDLRTLRGGSPQDDQLQLKYAHPLPTHLHKLPAMRYTKTKNTKHSAKKFIIYPNQTAY